MANGCSHKHELTDGYSSISSARAARRKVESRADWAADVEVGVNGGQVVPSYYHMTLAMEHGTKYDVIQLS
eukprot:scaffold299575_cov36-Tisochrysis_lutea.AAC.1